MPRSYRAILHGDRVEWIDPPPDADGSVEITITPLHEPARPARRGEKMAAALEAIALRGGFVEIPDPARWQREIRGHL
jgi:hypothetical protein